LVAAALLLGVVVSTSLAITAHRRGAEAILARNEAQEHLTSEERQRRRAEEATAKAIAESEQRRQAVIAAQEATVRETKAKEEQALLRQEAEQRGAAIAQQKTEIEGLNQKLEDSLSETRRSLYAAHLNLIPGAWEANNITRIREILQATRPLPGQEDLRGFEWFYWNRQCHSDLHTAKLEKVTRNSNVFLNWSSFSANGSRFAATSLRSSRPAIPRRGAPLPPSAPRP
jgi:hypothetical protein